MNKLDNALIQRNTVQTIDRSRNALYALRDTFVFDDTNVQEVVLSTAMCGSIVNVIDLLIDAMSHEIQRLTIKEVL